jgi:UDP-glucose 4-epimerase
MTDTYTVGVTGAAGFIGSLVTRNLLVAGHEVVPVDDFSVGRVEAVEGVEVREVDVRDDDALREAFAPVDAVVHLAAISSIPTCADEPRRAFDVNVGGTQTVAWFCRERGLPLVFPCSMAVFGTPSPEQLPITAGTPRDPANHYGLTKKMAEDDVHDLARGAFPAHVYVKSNIYGGHRVGGDRYAKRTVINVFVEQALDGGPLTVHRPGTQSRDFLHVRDAARAYAQSLPVLMEADPGARSLPIASGERYSVRELAEVVCRVVREERDREVAVELVENPRDEDARVADFAVDTTAARETIGFEAQRSVEGTIRELVR